ncbi:universal stress protein [Thermodesulfovibrio hydrogeniphilus]
MMEVEKIYVAIDFKPSTSTVLSYAVWLSNIIDCKKMTLFHIMEYTLTPPSYLMPYINKEKNKIEEQLSLLSKKLSNFSIDANYKVVFGRLLDSVKEVIKNEKGFMVMGFKYHITRPSTSERILKGMKIPTLVVKESQFNEITPDAIKIRKILCPIDFSEISIKALNFAKDIANKFNLELTVLHVVPEQKIKGIVEEPEQIEKYIEYLKEEAEDKIRNIDKDLNYQILSGIPAEEILKRVPQFDIVFIGSKGRSYTESVLIGSVAEAVIKNSKKPVLLMH